MPILEVDRAKSIIVLKRSMRPGFAGVDNDLYYNEKCMMLFGDAKESVTKLTTELGQLWPSPTSGAGRSPASLTAGRAGYARRPTRAGVVLSPSSRRLNVLCGRM